MFPSLQLLHSPHGYDFVQFCSWFQIYSFFLPLLLNFVFPSSILMKFYIKLYKLRYLFCSFNFLFSRLNIFLHFFHFFHVFHFLVISFLVNNICFNWYCWNVLHVSLIFLIFVTTCACSKLFVFVFKFSYHFSVVFVCFSLSSTLHGEVTTWFPRKYKSGSKIIAKLF